MGKKAITIRVPLNSSREEQFRKIFQMKQWAIKKIQENQERIRNREAKEYAHGDKLTINGEEFTLHITYSKNKGSTAKILQNNILLNIAQELSSEEKRRHIVTLLSRAIARKRLPQLQQKIQELNTRHFQHPMQRIFFKYQKSKWGSCSTQGNINISTRLLFAPDDILEYVCVHELAHLKEFNHSDTFWKLVEKAIPNYAEKIQWLKENGDKCGF